MSPSRAALTLVVLVVALPSCKRPSRAVATWVSAGEGTTCFGVQGGTVRCVSDRAGHPILFGRPGGEHERIPELDGHTKIVIGQGGACSLAPGASAVACVGKADDLADATPGADLGHDEVCRGDSFACGRDGSVVRCSAAAGNALGVAFEGKPHVVDALGQAAQIACGRAHVCVRLKNGTVGCAGDIAPDAFGPRGLRTYPGIFGVVSVASAGHAAYAVTREGGVYGWGEGVVPVAPSRRGQRLTVPTPIFLRP